MDYLGIIAKQIVNAYGDYITDREAAVWYAHEARERETITYAQVSEVADKVMALLAKCPIS